MRQATTLFVLGYVLSLYGLIAHFVGKESILLFIAGDVIMCVAGLMVLPRFIKTVKITFLDVLLFIALVSGLIMIIFG